MCRNKKFNVPYDIVLSSPPITSVLYEGSVPAEVVGHLASAGSKVDVPHSTKRVS